MGEGCERDSNEDLYQNCYFLQLLIFSKTQQPPTERQDGKEGQMALLTKQVAKQVENQHPLNNT